MSAVDTFRIPKLQRQSRTEEVVCVEEGVFAKFEEAKRAGKGTISLTAHFGNWEFITPIVTNAGFGGAVVGRRIYYEPFNRVIERIRQATGARVLYREDSPKAFLKILYENQVLGMLADQDVASIEGIFVPFFGRLAYTPTAPAKLSIASGAPILPVFMIREGKQYRFVADKLIWPKRDLSKEEAALVMTKEWSQVVEAIVRQYPEQWVWMHRRWKTQPKVKTVEKVV